MAKIYKPYGERKPIVWNHPGNRMEPEYSERLNERGHSYLEKTGERDVYQEIQSHKEEGDINCILARYAAGDMRVVRNGGIYIDATQLPSTMAGMLNLIKQKKEEFMELPLEIREAFGQDFDHWAATAGTDEWLAKMGMTKKQEEVKPNESEQ